MRHIQGLAAALLLGAAPTFAVAQVDLPAGATSGRSESPNQQQGQGTNQTRGERTPGQANQDPSRPGQLGREGLGQDRAGALGGQFDDQLFLAAARESGQAEIALSQLAAERASSDEVKQFARQMIEDHERVNLQLMAGQGRGGVDRQPGARPGAPGAARDPNARPGGAGTDREPITRPGGEQAGANPAAGRPGTAGAAIGTQAERTGVLGTPGELAGRAGAVTGIETRQAARPAFGAQGHGGQSAGHRAAYAILASKQGEEFDKCYIKGQVAAHMCAVGLFEAESEMGQEYKELATETLPTLKQHLQMAKQMCEKYESSEDASSPHGDRSPSREQPKTETPKSPQ